MHEPIEEFVYCDRTIRIWPDDSPESPREWDNVGVMYCAHKRYKLGDKQLDPNYHRAPSIERQLELDNPGAVILPIYMLDHSGIALSTSPFSCPWDSGQVGFIVATRAVILREFGKPGAKRITRAMRELTEKNLRAEVETYSQFLNGEVYGYTVSEPCEPETVADSCWGFFGFDYVREEAKRAADPVPAVRS